MLLHALRMKKHGARLSNTAIVLAPIVLALAFFAGAGVVPAWTQTSEKLPSVEDVLER
jgi:hypothetical protein